VKEIFNIQREIEKDERPTIVMMMMMMMQARKSMKRHQVL